jgi:signal transduction histidine kinase
VVDTTPESRRWRPPAGEIALAAGFAALGVAITVGLVEGAALVPAVGLTVAHSAVLAWRLRSPELVLAAMGVTGLAYVLAGWPSVGLGPAVLGGVHGLGVTRERNRALPVLAATSALMAIAVTISDAQAPTVIGNAIALTIAWWIGDRQRRTQHRAIRAERDSESRARQAVADERLRIARELHDVVAHALSVIAVQAGTGRVVLDTDPATAKAALAGIEGESRAALAEMRRLLEVLRADDDTDARPLAPSPGLHDLDMLIAATVNSGLPVKVRIEGEPAPLPAGVDLAAFRIVQEALTNVRRHAAATRAEVHVAWLPGAVEVEVLDDGHGSRNGTGRGRAGNGLVGMRSPSPTTSRWCEPALAPWSPTPRTSSWSVKPPTGKRPSRLLARSGRMSSSSMSACRGSMASKPPVGSLRIRHSRTCVWSSSRRSTSTSTSLARSKPAPAASF